MKNSTTRPFYTLRGRIMSGFLVIFLFFLAWLFAYYYISNKQNALIRFSGTLTNTQNHFLESNRLLELFIVAGYHDQSFYTNHTQKDIDSFLVRQKRLEQTLQDLKLLAKKNTIELDVRLNQLIALNLEFTDTVQSLKEVYFLRGFKDFGAEGRMREFAHELEAKNLVSEVNILQLRRNEKDFLIRGEMKYVDQFNQQIDQLLIQKKNNPQAYGALMNYKREFDSMVLLSNRLNIYNGMGLYAHAQSLSNRIQATYDALTNEAQEQVTTLHSNFKLIMIGISVMMALFILWLSLYLSKKLSQDLKELNKRVFAFIRSSFKEDEYDAQVDEFNPSIQEIALLHSHFRLLKDNLRTTLDNLGKAYHEAKQASDYKSTFLANMSHEIRTPLNGVTGMIYILKGTELSDKQKDCLNTAEFSANHLINIVNMILDYSKIDAGMMDLEKIPFDLKGDLEKMIRIFEPAAEEKKLNLHFRCDFNDSHYLRGDSLRLQQVLMNLLNNAIKFTRMGTVNCIITEVSRSVSNVVVRFEICDEGIGISEKQLKHLFKAFKQADISISRNFGGTGLGLTIADQLVKLMGGQLNVHSEVNKGTKFFFEVNFAIDREKEKLKEIDQPNYMDVEKTRVLIAEDNAYNQKVLEMMLEEFDVQVDIAHNGKEAVEMFEYLDYDLIFMDIRMPEMDGYEATALIKRSSRYQQRPIPIIACTANAFNEDKQKAASAGLDDFISKPVEPSELTRIFKKFGQETAANLQQESK